MSPSAVVIGAGPSGLAAAEALVERGHRVTLLEAGSQVGGLARSHRVGAHWADLGPHRLHEEASTRVRQLLSRRGLSERPRLGRIHLGGASVDYPLSALPTLRALGPCRAAHFAAGAVLSRLRPRDGSYAAEASRRVGEPVYRALYGPAARKVWGLDPAELDARQAHVRVGASGPKALLARALGCGQPSRYLYPSAGANRIAYDAWAEALRRRGVELLCDAPARAVLHDGGSVQGVSARHAGRDLWFPASRVISTLSLPRLLSLCAPALPGDDAERLGMRTLVLCYVVLGRPRLTDRDVHYFPDGEVPFARMTEQAAFGRTEGSPADETVLSFDFYDEPSGPLTRASADELLELVRPHLSRFGVERGEVRQVEKLVAHDAYPVFERGFQAARDRTLDRAASLEGLLPAGRAGLFLHVNQHHAIEIGLAAGEVASGAGAVSRRWRARAREFERYRIVD